ncbi:MAG: hypothetical protein Q9M92_00705 [Enterobacterales bacterium]|nr:hypothetical protein [Enterobacterales bacterium]
MNPWPNKNVPPKYTHLNLSYRLLPIVQATKSLVALVSMVFLFACASQDKAVSTESYRVIRLQIADSRYFGARPIIIRGDDVYKLSKQQLIDFKQFYSSKQNTHVKPYRRIFKYLQAYTKNYRFQNKTLTAQQTLARFEGNCLSLAILTTALAKSVSVKTGYQIVDSDPVYQEEGGIILASEHIQSLLYDYDVNDDNAESHKTKQIERGIVVDYFPIKGFRVRRRVTDNEFLALYYRNLAADAIIHRKYNKAYWLLIETFNYNSIDEHAVNMMALVHDKKGLNKNADKIYRQGIRYAQHKLDLLRNYSLFLKKEHRFSDAKKVQRQLAKINVVNPFDWINLGNTAYSQKKYRESRRYYLKAIKIAPYVHQAYLGIAKSEFMLGDLKAAKKSLLLAKTNTIDDDIKGYYQAKLNSLSKLSL